MSMYPHRGMGGAAPPPANTSRLDELLEQIRTEFNSQTRTTEAYEHQIQAQLSEMQHVREKVFNMEQLHLNLKQKYEDEVNHLRRQLDIARGNAPPGMSSGPPPHQAPSQQQPPSIPSGNGLFNGIMTGAGGHQGLVPPPPPPNQEQQQQQQQQQMGPQHQMPQGPPGLPAPPPPPPQSQPQQFQQQQGQQQGGQQGQQQGQQGQQQQPPYPSGPVANGVNSQPPQSTNSPGPRGRGIGRPPGAVGPATPQINTPIPFPGAPTQSPQVSHPTPDHARIGGPHAPPPGPPVGNALGELDPERLPPSAKKSGYDWFAIFNDRVPRMLDVDLVHTLTHESVVCCVRFSHDGKYVATGCNRSAQIYDVHTGEKLCVLMDETADVTGDLYIRSVCFSPDGKYLATGAEDKLIRVWDIQSRTIRNTFAGHEQDIYSLDFARDGRTIASGSGDRTVRLWDIETSSNTLTLTIEDGVTTVAISPDTKYVAAGSLDKSVRVWDLQQGFLLERLEGSDGHKDSVYSVAFSPNGKDLVSGSLDKTIKMWELNTPRNLSGGNSGKGRCIKTFEGHRDFVLSVALTPDAAWVMSGSKDRGVQFWDPRTGATQLMLQGHKNSVISVAPSPTGGYFATGSGDMRARIWSYRSVQ